VLFSAGVKGEAVNKLFKLKEWLSVAETARYLSILFGEDVAEADVLRLALDGHLKLSVYLTNGAYASSCVPKTHGEIEWDVPPSERGRYWHDDRGRFLVLPSITELENAVWDLPMRGGERIEVERKYQ
jgi:hypothetical protein